MPVSRHRVHDTRKPPPPANGHGDLAPLRLQQARVLAVLMPEYPSQPPFDWPLLTRTCLCLRLGSKFAQSAGQPAAASRAC